MNNLSEILQKIENALRMAFSRSSLLVAALILLVGGFFAYRNFTRQATPAELKIETSSNNGTASGVIAGGATGPEIKQQTFGNTGKVAGAMTQRTESTNVDKTWVARWINKDSLKETTTYKVQKGDTLWEIAKGKYGKGSDWHKILEANKDKIGYLADGTQALIRVGQEFVLP